MPPTHSPYSPELKRQMVELVRADRNPTELAIFEYLVAGNFPLTSI